MKKARRIFFSIIIILLIPLTGFSQQPPVMDQYILNPLLINPAFAGARGVLNFAALYRRQWAGLAGAPETMMVISDLPVSSDGNPGIGFSLITDKIGVTRENSFNTYYSYKVKAAGGSLYFGLKAGLRTVRTRWSQLEVLDPGDELFLTDSKVYVLPDFGFGTYLKYDEFFAGFSIPRLIGSRFSSDRNRYSLRIDPGEYFYLFTAGYLFDLAPDIRFMPSTLISVSPGQRVLVDMNAHFIFAERFWAGASFRTNKSVAAMVQFAVNRQLKFSYSNYYDFNRLGRFNNGTHEIMMRYEFMFKADVVNPLIF